MDKPALVISCIILNVRFCCYFGIISKPFNKLHSCAQSLRMSSYYSSSGFHAEDSFTVWHSFKLKCQASFPKIPLHAENSLIKKLPFANLLLNKN